jgi:glycosyltransferase involved in cell wall biosynthesis
MIDFEKLPSITPAAISLVLPVFNQQATLEAEVGDWIRFLGELGCGYEMILIDDGSFDRCKEIEASLSTHHPQLRVLHHDTRRGFGAALRTGLGAAQHPLLAYAAGGQGYRPADFKGMMKWIDEVHLVAGHRVAKAGSAMKTSWPLRRLARMAFGVHMRDLGCLFVLARRSIFERIPIQSNGSFAHFEVLAKANFLGCLMTEVPVSYGPAPALSWPSDRARTRAEIMRLFREPDFGPVKQNV